MSQAGTTKLSLPSNLVNQVTGTNGVTASPTTGNVVVSGVNATTSTVGVASFNPANFSVTGGVVSSLSSGSVFGPIVDSNAVAASNQTLVVTPYCSFIQQNTAEVFTLRSDAFYFASIWIDETKTFTKIGCNITASPGAGSQVMLALYDATGTGGFPGAVVASALSLSSAVTGVVEGTISAALVPGWFWIAIQRNTTGSVQVRSFGNNNVFGVMTNRMSINLSSLASTDYTAQYNYNVINTFGSFPANPTINQNSGANGVPIVHLR